MGKSEYQVPVDPSAAVEAGEFRVFPRGEFATGTESYDLDVKVVFEEGRFVIDEMTVKRKEGGPSVDRDGLRALPLTEVVEEGVTFLAEQGLVWAANTSGTLRPVWEALRDRQPEEDGPTDANLRHVASVYRAGLLLGRKPTDCVAKEMGVSRATAGRWVMLTRDKGYLGPAVDRRPGEKE